MSITFAQFIVDFYFQSKCPNPVRSVFFDRAPKEEKMGSGCVAGGSRTGALCFPAFCGGHGYAASLLGCTVQWRPIDRVLLAGEDGRLSRGPDHMSRWWSWRSIGQWGSEMGRQGEPKKGLNFSPCASSWWVRLECGVKCGVLGWFRLAYSELCTQLPPGSAPGGQAHPGGRRAWPAACK